MPVLKEIFEEISNGTFHREILELRYEDIGENECAEICKQLNGFQIRKLNLSNNKLNDRCVQMLLETFPGLEEVNVSANLLSSGSALALSKSNLKKLDVSFNSLGDEGASFLSLNKTIEDLNISGNNISIDGAIKLFSNHRLKQLNLMENNLENLETKNLPSIEENNTLQSLNLISSGITSDVIRLIKTKLTALVDLDLSHNTIGDEGAILLSGHPKLVSLNLTKNNIGYDGAIALSKNKTLESLILFDNKITNEGFMAFCENKSLKFLNVSSNKLYGNVLNQFLRTNSSLLELVAEDNKISSLDHSLLRAGRKVDLLGNPVAGVPLLTGYKRKSSDYSSEFLYKTEFEPENDDYEQDQLSQSPVPFSSTFF